MMRTRLVAGAALAVAAAALSACSQVSALAPVSGTALQTVRVAMLDILVEKSVPVLVAPTCVAVATGFTCTGSTTDGATITADATSVKPYSITVKVGTDTIYDGSVQDVLDSAAGVTP